MDSNLKSQIKSTMQHLQKPVVLRLLLDDSAKSAELSDLAKELVELSDLISISDHELQDSRAPQMSISDPDFSTQIHFAGVPMGHEFTSLILALLHTGGHQLKLDVDVIEQIKSLDRALKFETYISLSCQNCPDVVQALNMMAALNPNISHTMIDGALFQDEVDDKKIMAVPSVYLNGEAFSQGRISLKEMLAKVDKNAGKREVTKLNNKSSFDMLIIGGGPAGASAAIYAARKGINTGIVSERFGGQVQDTMAIENFISVPATDGPKLVANLEAHVRDYDVDVMDNQRVKNITPTSSSGELIAIELENGAVLSSRSVLVATGARWREMNVPGEQEYRGRGVAYCPHCDGPLFKGKDVAVIGGGNSGIEAAIDLAGVVRHVTVLEFSDRLRADDVLLRKAKSMSNIHIITEAQTTEVRGNGEQVTGLTYIDRITGEAKEIGLSGIFVQIGLVPNSDFLPTEIERTQHGEVIVNAKGETTVQGIFAAGDVTNCPFKQIVIALGSGANAALGSFEYLIRTSAVVDNTEQAA